MAAKLRIPKVYNIGDNGDYIQRKNALWEATLDTEKHQINGEAIYTLLDDKTKREITEDEVWVAVSFMHQVCIQCLKQ